MRSAKIDQASRSLYLYAAYHTARPVETPLVIPGLEFISRCMHFAIFLEDKVKYPPLRQVAPPPSKNERLCT